MLLCPHKNKTKSRAVVNYITNFISAKPSSRRWPVQAEQGRGTSRSMQRVGQQIVRTTTFLAGDTESTVDGEEVAAGSGDGRRAGGDGG